MTDIENPQQPPPPAHPPTQQQRQEEETVVSSSRPALNDFDLNVVDEALLHPDNAEYQDHFGFTVQVKSDHEYDSSDVSSLEEDEEDVDGENNTISTKNTTLSSSSSVMDTNLTDNDRKQFYIPSDTEKVSTTSSNVGLEEADTLSAKAKNERISNSMHTDVSECSKGQEEWQIVNEKNQTSPPLSTVTSSTTVSATPTASTTASTTSYYEMLLSRFRRRSSNKSTATLSNTNSASLKQIKEEIHQSLQHLKKDEYDENIDWDFWASVIFDFEKVKRTDHARFRHFLTIGIPPPLRGKLWRIFSNSDDDDYYSTNDDTQQTPSTTTTTASSATDNDLVVKEYVHLLNQSSPYEKLIRRDLSRTFPHVPFFKDKEGEGQEMLFNVIKAYSLFDTHVGYCQGLHFVVGVLLLHMPDEAAFCVLIKLMSQYGLRGHFTPQMETLHERMYQFEHLLQLYLPQVHRHLDAQGVLPSMYASQWFMTLYAYRCPLDLVYRVFDLLFVEGSSILLNFALALMKKNQSIILSLEFESLLEFLSGGSSSSSHSHETTGSIFDVYSTNKASGAYEFVQDAFAFDIPPKLLAKLAKQYQFEAAKEAKLQSIEDAVKRENAQLTEQIHRLRNAYKTLERDHQEVTQHVIQSKLAMASLDAENQQLQHELSVMKQEMAKMKNTYSSASSKYKQQFEQLAKQNAHLVETNSTLEDRVADLETVLIDMKIKYAESESEYELMRQKLQEAQRLTNVSHRKST